MPATCPRNRRIAVRSTAAKILIEAWRHHATTSLPLPNPGPYRSFRPLGRSCSVEPVPTIKTLTSQPLPHLATRVPVIPAPEVPIHLFHGEAMTPSFSCHAHHGRHGRGVRHHRDGHPEPTVRDASRTNRKRREPMIIRNPLAHSFEFVVIARFVRSLQRDASRACWARTKRRRSPRWRSWLVRSGACRPSRW